MDTSDQIKIEADEVTRGKPTSGKVWKTIQIKKSSSMFAHKKGWERQQKERRQREIVLALKREKQQELQQQKEVFFDVHL
jgi:hypothetical protein